MAKRTERSRFRIGDLLALEHPELSNDAVARENLSRWLA